MRAEALRAHPIWVRWSALHRLLAAALLIGLGWAGRWWGGAGGDGLYAGAMVAAAAMSGTVLARRAVAALRLRTASIELLVSVAAAGAIAIGEYWEAAAVTWLFDLGGYLEWRTLERARAAIRALAEWAPQTATVRRPDGREVEVRAEAVQPGDVLVVRSGDKLAADGVVVQGEAEVDQAALTGESMPVARRPGDRVLAGSVAVVGYMEVQATRVGQETTFGRIVELVGEAQATRTRVQSVMERFARFYTPAIIALAAITLVVTRDVHLALTLLVVGCPGALVLAAPVSLVAGLGRAARAGVLIKGGQRLDRLASVTAVAFDKTGTLTAGKPEVGAVHTLAPFSPEELLWLAGSAERGSEHPLGAAIREAAATADGGRALAEPGGVRVLPGQGLVATVAGRRVLVGNETLLRRKGVRLDGPDGGVGAERAEPASALAAGALAAVQRAGQSAVLVAVDGKLAGVLGLADRMRPGAGSLAVALRQAGVRHVALLSGDNPPAAAAAARAAGIEHVEGGLLPDEKAERIRALQRQGHVVAMVGDGINDAPALASADVSIAVGVGGTDAAMEAADVALMSDDLARVPMAIRLARAIVRNVRQNLAFAVAVVLALVGGVLAGAVNLASGMLVHELSVLVVILNGMRLLRADARP